MNCERQGGGQVMLQGCGKYYSALYRGPDFGEYDFYDPVTGNVLGTIFSIAPGRMTSCTAFDAGFTPPHSLAYPESNEPYCTGYYGCGSKAAAIIEGGDGGRDQ